MPALAKSPNSNIKKLYSNLNKEYITGKGKQAERVKARDLLCYWCNSKLGISMADLSRKLCLTPAALSIAVRRGEKAAKEGEYLLGN